MDGGSYAAGNILIGPGQEHGGGRIEDGKEKQAHKFPESHFKTDFLDREEDAHYKGGKEKPVETYRIQPHSVLQKRNGKQRNESEGGGGYDGQQKPLEFFHGVQKYIKKRKGR